MSQEMNAESTLQLLEAAVEGNETGWQQLQELHRQRLHRMVAVRLDQRMRSRVDASDVVQDAFLEAWQKLGKYLEHPTLPFYLWLRSITGHKLMSLHRFHLGTAMRAAGREISMHGAMMPETTSVGLAEFLAGENTNASEAAIRAERVEQLRVALDQLEPIDREILTLRHFEQLSNSEVASVLNIETSAASKRYIRALRKIKHLVADVSREAGGNG